MSIRVPWPCLFALSGLLLWSCPEALAQQDAPMPLRLGGVYPSGLRSSATESWGLFDFSLTNLTDTDRQARVLAFYEGGSAVQYGRDVWVPARSELRTWMLVGPAKSRNIQTLLYDRTDGKAKLLLPRGERRVRSRGLPYRKRELFTAVLLNEDVPPLPAFGQLPEPEPAADEVSRLVRTFRETANLSEFVQRVNPGQLPPTPEAFDGIDHFVIASGRLAHDPVGLRALRQWLEQGGKVWVLLDKVEQAAIGPLLGGLLGEALDFTVVDRVSLTSITITAPPVGQGQPQEQEPAVLHDRPVDLVRVLLPARERLRHTVDGWPTWFTRQVGRGKVVVSTLGPRAWHRPRRRRTGPRTNGDPESRFRDFPSLPMPTDALKALANELQPADADTPSDRKIGQARPEEIQASQQKRAAAPFDLDTVQTVLNKEIGYSVAGRGTVALVFGVFLLGTLGLQIVLRRSRRPELVGWLAPTAALAAAGVFVALGVASRRSAPPSVAVIQIVDAVPGTDEATIHGLLGVYRPDSGLTEARAERGGLFELDRKGAPGQWILTDTDAWHWEDLSLPAGVRWAPFQYTAPTRTPISAVAQLGAEELEGKLAAGPFSGSVADAILVTPSGRNLAVRLRPDGSFRTGPRDILPAGQFLAGDAVLTDRQQQQQTLYRDFIPPNPYATPMTDRNMTEKEKQRVAREKQRLARYHDFLQQRGASLAGGRSVLLAWAKPAETHFQFAPGARTIGMALLVVPLQLKRSAKGNSPAVHGRVTIPGPLVACRRVVTGGETRLPRPSRQGATVELRFQIPRAVLPFKVERARLVTRIKAPSRLVTFSGQTASGPVELQRVDSPLDPIRLDIARQDLLLPDAQGGLHLTLTVSDPPRGEGAGKEKEQQKNEWAIDYIELEITGREE